MKKFWSPIVRKSTKFGRESFTLIQLPSRYFVSIFVKVAAHFIGLKPLFVLPSLWLLLSEK
jgi:hypothetical protein